MISILIIALSVIGLWISFYFTGVYYNWFSPYVPWIPKVCQVPEKGCATIVRSPRAKLFGIPTATFGLFVYTYLIVDVFLFPPLLGFFLLSAASLRSVYLTYSLLYVTKVSCPLCFTSHAINLSLFAIYLFFVFG